MPTVQACWKHQRVARNDAIAPRLPSAAVPDIYRSGRKYVPVEHYSSEICSLQYKTIISLRARPRMIFSIRTGSTFSSDQPRLAARQQPTRHRLAVSSRGMKHPGPKRSFSVPSASSSHAGAIEIDRNRARRRPVSPREECLELGVRQTGIL